MIKIRIQNLDKLARKYAKAPRDLASGLHKAIERTGVYFEGLSIEVIRAGTNMWQEPVDSGAMWQNIRSTSSGLTATVATSTITPYAIYVHQGTKFMKARPFFDITARTKEKQITDFVDKEVSKLINTIL